MQQWKKVVVLGLFVFLIGGTFAFAEEPVVERTPLRTRILEILQNHPEVLAEIQELREEWQASDFPADEPGFTGMMRGRMMRRGQMQGGRMAGRQQMRGCYPLEGNVPMMGPRWNQ